MVPPADTKIEKRDAGLVFQSLCIYCTKLEPISKIADNVPRAERVVA